MDRDPILLTPGPLRPRCAPSSRDAARLGFVDADFNAVTARLRAQLLDIVHGHETHVVVPLQGSGTFSVEAAVATVVPRDGHVLVLETRLPQARGAADAVDGAKGLGARLRRGRAGVGIALEARLAGDASITHAILIHCETGTGVLNPFAEVSAVCERHGKGLIVCHAMSSFGALPIDARELRFDALVAASGKRREGVPGMGFVFLRKAILEGCAAHSQSLAMDLHDEYTNMEKTIQWRFTPPT